MEDQYTRLGSFVHDEINKRVLVVSDKMNGAITAYSDVLKSKFQ